MGTTWYRVRQFWRALVVVKPSAVERAYVAALPPAQRGLFAAMDRADQRHCLDVYNLLVAWGCDDVDLLHAALLHDVGKGLARIRLWHRVLIVLGDALGRGLVDRLASERPKSWRYPLHVHRHHVELGTSLAEAAGCRPKVVKLIRGHGAESGDALARALRRADCMC